jgi:hypothetical protein
MRNEQEPALASAASSSRRLANFFNAGARGISPSVNGRNKQSLSAQHL